MAAVAIQLLLPASLAFRPRWVLPGAELALFCAVVAMNPTRVNRESTVLRWLGLSLAAAVSVGTAWSAGLLVYRIVFGHATLAASALLVAGGGIWLTNVIVFALWYWETDRGGPAARAHGRDQHPDFLFMSMTVPELAGHDWEPAFVDYLYLSFTNATAFSPTDTAPLARWAKMAMLCQSAVSMVTVILVVARAINILG